MFIVGDKVKVRPNLSTGELKAMQAGHGGWNPLMEQYMSKVGTVRAITARGDVAVQYEGCAKVWSFNSDALTKVDVFQVEDIVRIIDNLALVKQLQSGHGEWNDGMRTTLGKVGLVKKVYPDGDLRVEVNDHTWTFNPDCCILVRHGKEDKNSTLSAGRDSPDPALAFTNFLAQVAELMSHDGGSGPDRLVGEAAQGNVSAVRDILAKHPDKVDQKQDSGVTALHVSSFQGHTAVIQLLLSAKASLEVKDEDGDTALTHAAYGNEPEVIELLLSKGAKIDSVNEKKLSALHVAVNKGHKNCVKVLLKRGINPNLQDAFGDTALHDAIGKDNREIMEMLINHDAIDFTRKNNKGFNALHHAAIKGNEFATRRILPKSPQIVDSQKDDGFTALHLAAFNGHDEVAQVLLDRPANKADIEMRTNSHQTPLHLAVAKGHTSMIELLVRFKANVNARDEDGDTCLHLALMRQYMKAQMSPVLNIFLSQLGMADGEDKIGAATACYLAQHGADLGARNKKGQTPLDIISDPGVVEVVKKASAASSQKTENRAGSSGSSGSRECEVCSSTPAALVTFEPCGHSMVCPDCCLKMKKCLKCKAAIERKNLP